MVKHQKTRNNKKNREYNTLIIVILFIAIIGGIYLTGSITGFLTETGTADIIISGQLSVDLTDTNIEFGDCIPYVSGYAVLSNESDIGNCSGTSFPDYMRLQNDGSVDCNVTINASGNAESFIGGTNPDFNFSIINDTLGGCSASQLSGWNTLENATPTLACGNLSVGANNAINLSIGLWIPVDAESGTFQESVYFHAFNIE